MITIGTVKFDFQTSNEEFAQSLYGRWDRFFQASFEAVAEEVMVHYDRADEMLMIDRLPIELPVLPEEDFDRSFSEQLREALHDYFRRLMVADSGAATSSGVRRMSVEQNTLDILCFFLLYGYLPVYADRTQNDINKLLEEVLRMAPNEFRQFLERYAHYDFLYKRLISQFDDGQLEAIVDKAHPSEAKFIHLYTRVQIRSYRLNQAPEMSYTDYRNAVWTLVLAYLFHEGGGRFNKKQLVLHTLRGLSTRFNLSFIELTCMLSDKLDELEKSTVNLRGLWSILKEIRSDIHGELLALDGNYLKYACREIIDALRIVAKEETAWLLTPENLATILSDPDSCCNLLRRLSEPEICRLVKCVIPYESEFIITHARLLDKQEERGYFGGKARGDFRQIKWEYIFAVIYHTPLSFFNRKQFVLQVTQRLAAHYDLPAVLSYAPSTALFIKWHTEHEIQQMVQRIIPGESEFILSYAQLLDKYAGKGLLEGKAGADFRVLKWEFIFSCLLVGEQVAFFHRKYFVYNVIKQLAAHYNQQVVALLEYFYKELGALGVSSPYTALVQVLNELYHETLLAVSDAASVRQLSKVAAEQWITCLFGVQGQYGSLSAASRGPHGSPDVVAHCLEEQNDIFRALWKAGKLDEPLIFSILRQDEKLQRLWIRRIGDARLLEVYRTWMKRYADLRQQFPGAVFLQTIASYLALWIVQLTARRYASWSTSEIELFLSDRVRRSLPEGMAGLLNEKNKNTNNIHIKQIVTIMTKDLSNIESVNEPIWVENAGVVLFYPFYVRLFNVLSMTMGKDPYKLRNEEEQLKAIFLLQYAAYGNFKESFEEPELTLNKIIVNWEGGPLPKKYALTENDKYVVDEMIFSGRTHWEKLRTSTNDTLRISFFERRGAIKPSNTPDSIRLEVESRPYDVLLDSLPWSISQLRLFNSEKRLEVKWRK